MRTFLCLNYGSSSLKYALFREEELLLKNKVPLGGEEKLEESINTIREQIIQHPEVILHRVVHGMNYESPMPINSETLTVLERLAHINPLHNSIALEGIRISLKLFETSHHYAIFDTDFHKSIPEYCRVYGVDYDLYRQGIKKYGFHGISYSYLLKRSIRLLQKEKPNLIMIHLGQGCSICAVKAGTSVDTSMGFTPLEGLLMVSRSGDIDAGVILHMLRLGISPEDLERKLYRESGIKAICNASNFEELLILREKKDERAVLAFESFVYKLFKYIGAYWFLLEGDLDALVFSGGIGENNPELRERICQRLNFIGVKIDQEANKENREIISSQDSSIKVFVIKTDEEREMVNIFKGKH